jgi:hypothetical protein
MFNGSGMNGQRQKASQDSQTDDRYFSHKRSSYELSAQVFTQPGDRTLLKRRGALRRSLNHV